MLVMGIEQGRGDGGAWGPTNVEPRPQHPGPVLLELEALDVDVGQAQGPDEHDCHNAGCDLHIECSAEGIFCDDERARCPDETQKQNKVAVEAVEQDDLVADGGHELEAGEEAGGQDGAKVDDDAGPFDGVFFVVVAVELGVTLAAKYAVVADVLEPRQGEAEHGTGKDEEEDEVVAFGEPDRVVYFSHHPDEGICWWAAGCCCHFGRWDVDGAKGVVEVPLGYVGVLGHDGREGMTRQKSSTIIYISITI